MNKSIFHIFNIALLFFGTVCFGQTIEIIKPGPEEGIDVSICSSPSWSTGEPLNNKNFGNQIYQRNASWTANSHGEPEHDWWSLIKFNALDTMENFDIHSARLKMYYPPNYPYTNGGRDGFNETNVYRITEEWDELETTWLDRPSIDSNNPIVIPTNNDYDTIVVDVTDWVREMAADPATNQGFFFIPADDTPYRSMSFASSDHENESLWPELIIEYEVNPTDTCVFEYPNVFTPDGNGVNDVFSVVSNCDTGYSVEMMIYDRWGNRVFSSNGSNIAWDGNIGGKAAASGVYIFSATVVSEFDQMVFRGSVTLLR